MEKKNVAIIGAGRIAGLMAEALSGLSEYAVPYAIASRDLEKARSFAKQWNFQKAYGSYAELVEDEAVDLVYIATPHSHHFEHAKLCVEHGKAVLVEKAFTANLSQAKELIALAEEKNIFLTEAIWTRYMPSREIIASILESGVIGAVKSMESEFCVPLTHKQRMYDPNLAGGALLDLGMYNLTFAAMFFGNDIVSVESTCEKYETGVDGTDEILYGYRDGKTAKMKTSFVEERVNQGIVYGSAGSLLVKDLNNPSQITVFDSEGRVVRDYPIPSQINGYEYEVIACVKALNEGKTECKEMPHKETLEIMRQMDELRKTWGVRYPFE